MKKSIALLLALVMLFALTACEGDKEGSESVGGSAGSTTESSTGSTVESTDSSSSNVQSDTESTNGSSAQEEASKPTTSNIPEDGPSHTHTYISKVTTPATCNKDGVKTFTCSCGESYTEKIAASGHTWGDWKVKTTALVGKAGKEERVCSVCSSSDTKESTKNAAANSFRDWGLVVIVMNDYGSINASTLLEYACCTFDEYHDKPVASNVIFNALSERFDIEFSDTLKNEMKSIGEWRYGYNKTNDTFRLFVNAVDPGEFKLLGYVHNNGSKYTTYYSFKPHEFDVTLNFAVELEYNLLSGKPNKYLSIKRTDTLPGNMIASN